MQNMNGKDFGHANYMDAANLFHRPTRLRDFGAFRIDNPPTEQVDGNGSTLSVMESVREPQSQANPATPPPEADVIARLPMLLPDKTVTVSRSSSWQASALMEGSTVPVVIPFPDYEPGARKQDEWRFERAVQQKALFLALQVVCSAAMCVLLFRDLTWSALIQGLSHLSLDYALLALLVGGAGILIGCYQWRVMVQGEQLKVGLVALVRYYLVGLAFSYVVPFGMSGERAKAFYLGKSSGKPRGADSAVDATHVSSLIGLVALALPLAFLSAFPDSWILPGFFFLATLFGLYVAGAIGLSAKMPELQYRWPRFRPLVTWVHLGDNLGRAGQRHTLLRAIFMGMLFWSVTCFNYYCFANALHLTLPFPVYCVVIALVTLVTLLPISLKGYGLRELLLVSIFSTLHVPVALSLLLALLMDGQNILFGLLGAIFIIDN